MSVSLHTIFLHIAIIKSSFTSEHDIEHLTGVAVKKKSKIYHLIYYNLNSSQIFPPQSQGRKKKKAKETNPIVLVS